MCVLNVFMLSKSEVENKQVKLEEENNVRVESFTVKERDRERKRANQSTINPILATWREWRGEEGWT